MSGNEAMGLGPPGLAGHTALAGLSLTDTLWGLFTLSLLSVLKGNYALSHWVSQALSEPNSNHQSLKARQHQKCGRRPFLSPPGSGGRKPGDQFQPVPAHIDFDKMVTPL